MNVTSLAERFRGRGPLIMIVLDGWGIGAHDEGDAIHHARKPTMDALLAGSAHSAIYTHGLYVGLPAPKDIGGSEVGHMTMGAGRIMAQGPTRIGRLLASGAFFESEVLRTLIDNCVQRNVPLHLIGLLSDGNVHSHITHFERIIDHAAARGVRRLYVHALLDGRDVPYQSALDYVEPLEAKLAALSRERPGRDYAIASGGGREVITMDRDQNWEKVRRGWAVHVHGREGEPVASASAAIRAARERAPDMVDQDLPPFVVVRAGRPVGPIQDGHSVVFMNFRGDRAIEFSRAMVEDDFAGFDRSPRPRVRYAGMMKYDEDTNLPPETLVETAGVERPFGRRILELGMHQFRLAETQKYAHVTFFFNGGYREPLDPSRETYELIPSERVDSFAKAPAMRAREIGQKAEAFIRSKRYRFGLINFANTDMVGHTGDLVAAIKATEAVDRALAGIVNALREVGGLALVTADHGNAEEMIALNPKTGRREPSTRHSLNPVPVVLFDPLYRGAGDYRLRPLDDGKPNTLANVMATHYILLGLKPPDDVDAPLFDLA
ncbi:MAG: 2,3-bisphosphoglycerate-independent phosphoglycerate mutase [Candidatus Lambdaproteobacteria bacterium]|nr:2,3-bisphosphoglycerate-independent phosphoglycerate mutase [Candidatus Lambdaproteobacteria bacterium]